MDRKSSAAVGIARACMGMQTHSVNQRGKYMSTQTSVAWLQSEGRAGGQTRCSRETDDEWHAACTGMRRRRRRHPAWTTTATALLLASPQAVSVQVALAARSNAAKPWPLPPAPPPLSWEAWCWPGLHQPLTALLALGRSKPPAPAAPAPRRAAGRRGTGLCGACRFRFRWRRRHAATPCKRGSGPQQRAGSTRCGVLYDRFPVEGG